MKNIIALSTVLAAGTLCVNAGTTIASSPTVTLDDYRYLISSWTQVSNPSDLNSTTAVNAGVSSALAQSWAAAFTLSPVSTTSTTAYTVFSTNSNDSGSYKFYYTPSTTTLAFNTSATESEKKFSLSNIDLTKAITIGFIKVADAAGSENATGFFFAQNGTNYATTDVMSFSGTGYQLDTTATFWPNTNDGKQQINLSNITVYSAGLASATHIPEPSMFGLLAGTLVLGLAGTRRRRRGNAK